MALGLARAPGSRVALCRGGAPQRRALGEFVAPRLLPQLGGTVSRFRRGLRFALVLLGVALALVSSGASRVTVTPTKM